ncbi:HAD family hydrolase [Sulfuriroseicoccus oceanibius]|uniref:Haloacid dehalogenase-like hydrolase n=1 Tax=Sulfuriroseicoccus oceanibius TaxID=2707525 RepID=A0A6B3L9X5_9BACT|nr:HAD family hydrolase [Sulfuriroseicoccus oceanibius]QQL45545.1 haloacid dehalogenase-like hydrolase [Sulfuriroseicoccus oceanibius]
MKISTVLAAFVVVTLSSLCSQENPLPSWNDGPSKAALVAFVEKVTTPNTETFVQPADRIAVFDNDGTLWAENPLPFQLIFAIEEIQRLAPENPEWKDNATIQAVLDGEVASLKAGGMKALNEVLAVSHAGLTPEEFAKRVADWMTTAKHPRFERPYNECVYLPMLEVLDYLRNHDFKVYIVSGGGADFMRVFAEQVYGIPPQQVIGSYGNAEYQLIDDQPVMIKTPGVAFVDDKEGKPVAIHRFIGKRPIACFGNSDGDKAMLEWTTIGRTPSFGMIIHHTDAEREYAYDKAPKSSGKLIKALEDAAKRNWTVVDMKTDWATVFPKPGEKCECEE